MMGIEWSIQYLDCLINQILNTQLYILENLLRGQRLDTDVFSVKVAQRKF